MSHSSVSIWKTASVFWEAAANGLWRLQQQDSAKKNNCIKVACRAEPELVVLFVDIVGFTTIAENAGLSATIGLLREFHDVMASQVHRNDGSVEKLLGDGLMATFDNQASEPNKATNSLRCAKGMLTSIKSVNAFGEHSVQDPLRIGVGVHIGEVAHGIIGQDRCCERAVVGDTVNVASRLEALTRLRQSSLIVSDALVDAVRREEVDTDLLDGLVRCGSKNIRGRKEKLCVWEFAQDKKND